MLILLLKNKMYYFKIIFGFLIFGKCGQKKYLVQVTNIVCVDTCM